MNKLFNSLTLLFLLSLFSCRSNSLFQVECKSFSSDGYIEMTVWNQTKCFSYSRNQAKKDAVKALLYSGVKSTAGCPLLPPLLRNEEERKSFEKISTDFFSSNGQWSVFTRNATREKNKRNNFTTAVDLSGLRKYLEQNKILKPIDTIF